MKTKHLVRFLARAAHFEADIELADILGIASAAGVLSQNGSEFLFDSVAKSQHPRLAQRKNNDHNRRLAVRHLKASLCASYIKDLYEDFAEYMRSILEAAAKNGINPSRLIGEQKISFEANELLAAKNWDNVVNIISCAIFRRLEDERSTKSLIQTMDKKLGLGIDAALLDAALPYFELRHLLVHRDGIADADFCKRFPSFPAKAGDKISVEFVIVKAAKTAVTALAKHFDRQVIAHKLVATKECQG